MTKAKATEQWIADLRDALLLTDAIDITERQRKTLRRACAEALVEAEDRIQFDYEHRNSGSKWTETDLQLLEETLKEAPICSSWGGEHIILETMVQRLGRTEKTIKKKAIELGYGRKVDYLMNNK